MLGEGSATQSNKTTVTANLPSALYSDVQTKLIGAGAVHPPKQGERVTGMRESSSLLMRGKTNVIAADCCLVTSSVLRGIKLDI